MTAGGLEECGGLDVLRIGGFADWLLRRLCLLRDAHPVLLAAEVLKTSLRNKIASQYAFVFHTFVFQVNLSRGIKNKKMP